MNQTSKDLFQTTGTFETNAAVFSSALIALDAVLAPRLIQALSRLADGSTDRPALLDGLLSDANSTPEAPTTTAAPAPAVSPAATVVLPRWFLERLEIEGFRGINNEGAPLVLKFKSDAVNSVSAPNGVGKSSIYDALSFALTKGIPKIDNLLASERDRDYYVNLFHPGHTGLVKLVLRPDDGGKTVTISVARDVLGLRTVTGPAGIDADALLGDLNREFVLLDAQKFQSFIDEKALERGRTFSGLLGLGRYSLLRQALQGLSNTRAFNSHFDTSAHVKDQENAEKLLIQANTALAKEFEGLVKEPLDPRWPLEAAQAKCHDALAGIPILKRHCDSVLFMDLDTAACIETIKEAEGGAKKQRLSELLRTEADWAKASRPEPTPEDAASLVALAAARERAFEATAGALLNDLFRSSQRVLQSDSWANKELCPTCGYRHETSVLEIVHAKLAEYETAELASGALAKEWVGKGWSLLVELEARVLADGEPPLLKTSLKSGEAGTISSKDAEALGQWLGMVRERAAASMAALAAEREDLERELPPSLVAVTTAVESVRRLQQHWRDQAKAEALYDAETARAGQITQVKKFLDGASQIFADAESGIAAARLKGVEPLCQELFKNIMFSDVVPALSKPVGSEELSIRLAEFFSAKNVSAQALLSESYRNAFAVSVYLAAASLYGGPPRFMVLDDVTSSFDAGHQHHLIEVIRTRFALPKQATGPQVILLSHDTLLEKLFNKHANGTEWSHQRLEGNARTAVLLQSGAANKVREALGDLLDAGRVDDAAPRIRQYLEYALHDVIDRCRIPVPMDLAFGDDKRTPGEYLTAIEEAVKLNKAAGVLILDASQEASLVMHSATIVGNFLSHWSTGQTHAFSAPALKGVVSAIDAYPDSFKYEPSPGASKRYYRSLSRR